MSSLHCYACSFDVRREHDKILIDNTSSNKTEHQDLISLYAIPLADEYERSHHLMKVPRFSALLRV